MWRRKIFFFSTLNIQYKKLILGVINETSEVVKSLVDSEMNAVVKLRKKKIYPWNRNIKTFHHL